MDLPKSVYEPIKSFYLRNPLEGGVREKENHT